MKFSFLIIMAAFALQGCSSLSKTECQVGDWKEYGRRDASNGKSGAYAAHVEACSEYSINPNKADYDKGFQEGLVTYCTEENGFQVGSTMNARNPQICPAKLAGAFEKGFKKGSELSRLRNDLREVEDKIDTTEQNMAKASGKDKLIYVYELRELDRKKSTIEAKIAKAEEAK